MQFNELYTDHARGLQDRYDKTLGLLNEAKVPIEAVLLHSGSRALYYADDAEIIFRPNPHFSHWLPIRQPDQMILVRPGSRPVYFHVEPESYWTDNRIPVEPVWAETFDRVDLSNPEQVIDHLGSLRRIAFMGENTAFASRIGMPSALLNVANLRNSLDFHRSVKSAYEIALIREANRVAMKAHRVAADVFTGGGSELAVHQAYLDSCGVLEQDMPYETIVGFDDRSAVMHYQHKRTEPTTEARSMIIDAGYRLQGYASDITRTHAKPGAHPVYHQLIQEVTRLKDLLIDEMKPGISFKDLNARAHQEISRILVELDIARGDCEELVEKKVTSLFFPHGLGHFLGLQVHDVGGLFKDETGILEPPPHEHKALRLARKLVDGMVVTVEPGFYFIPMLLEDPQHQDKRPYLNPSLVDALTPLGGVRIEDNVVIREQGVENLTP